MDGHAVRALERAGLASTVPAEMLLLRRYAHLVPDLTGAPAPAETLWEALTEAHFDRDANRWRLQLDDTGLAGLAHAVHLEALVGGVTHRNRLRRAHDLDHPHPIPRRVRRRRLSGRGEPGVTGAVPADC
ncbi:MULTISPECIES: DUF6417 family protein [Streptomyces]|uniref:Uncharacterized protein n=1 Tax=Streptomyces fradiae TaxID=1906 RepID=A0ACC4WH16_STRFR|nr:MULTISPECIES: DUF6417 family protein [Streptomyces]KNE83885.1 hypothetical protein ADZ36_02840 [Streptomyces fradiae]OFA55763.1 hypothetical protein BEN35_07470 [Streptomyces fradiae]